MSAETLVAAPQSPRSSTRSLIGFLRRYYFSFALALFIVLLVLVIILNPNVSWPDQIAVFAPLAIAGMASTPAVVSGRGSLDISIGPLMILCAVVFASVLIPAGLGGPIAIPIVLAVGAAFGVINGLIIVYLRIPAVVVTLAMYFVVAGISLKLAPTAQTIGDNWVGDLGTAFGPIPGGAVLIAIPIVIWGILSRTVLGRQLFASGGNDATALASGVNVRIIKIGAFGLGGLFAGVGAFAILALVRSADPGQSTAYTLLAIAAVALGGTSLLGGRGGVLGSLLGAGCIFLIQSLLGILQISGAFLGLFYGALLLIAVAFGSTLTKSTREKK